MSEENNNGVHHDDWSNLTGDVIVCFGGFEGEYQLDTVEAYNVNDRVWVELPNMPLARDSMAAGTDGKVVVLAGGSDRKTCFSEVMVFDWRSKEWNMTTPMPSVRAYAASAMHDGRLLVAGGSDNVELETCLAFDLKTEKWSDLPNMPGGPRARSGGAVINNHFFVVGGDVLRRPTRKVEAFNINENKWVTFPSMKSRRRRCALVAHGDNQLIASGGLTSDDITLDTMEMFDMRNRKWMELPAMPWARFGFCACVVNNQLYVVGGNERMKMRAPADRCDSFDLKSEEWNRIPPMIYRRLHASGFKMTV